MYFHDKRGELRQRYREGQLGALGLVLNIIVLWDTIYIHAALGQLRDEGFTALEEDIARLSPTLCTVAPQAQTPTVRPMLGEPTRFVRFCLLPKAMTERASSVFRSPVVALRSGFLTSAARNRASIFKMADQSRHNSLDVLREYVRNEERFEDHAGDGLLKPSLP